MRRFGLPWLHLSKIDATGRSTCLRIFPVKRWRAGVPARHHSLTVEFTEEIHSLTLHKCLQARPPIRRSTSRTSEFGCATDCGCTTALAEITGGSRGYGDGTRGKTSGDTARVDGRNGGVGSGPNQTVTRVESASRIVAHTARCGEGDLPLGDAGCARRVRSNRNGP